MLTEDSRTRVLLRGYWQVPVSMTACRENDDRSGGGGYRGFSLVTRMSTILLAPAAGTAGQLERGTVEAGRDTGPESAARDTSHRKPATMVTAHAPASPTLESTRAERVPMVDGT